MLTGMLCVMYCLVVISVECSHYFLADNYTKYIGWMLYDKVHTHTHTTHCTLY